MSAARHYQGPWLSNEAASRLPHLRNSFDRNRDPMIAKQMDDLAKSEAERRQEQAKGDGRGSGMVGQDKPAMHHRPPPAMRRGVDQSAFQGRWLAEQRDAALAKAKSEQGQHIDQPAPSRVSPTPSR